jgi:hypothetical protein
MASLPRWNGETKMMNDITSKNLPQEPAIQYLLQVLKNGGVTDTNAVDTQLGQGVCHAIAPNSVDGQRLVEFELGGILPTEPKVPSGEYLIQAVPNTASIAASIVSKELLDMNDPVLWIHEPLLIEKEVIAKHLPYQRISKELYLLFDKGAETPTKELIQRSLLSWHFLAIVTDRLKQVESVEYLIQCAKLILVGAYDGESFLYWKQA